MRYLQTMVAALASVLALAIPASAQQGTAQIQGKISDAQGALLPGVTVTVRNQDTGMFRETVSNPDGSYFISGITPGTYRMTAELQGFRKFERSGILLEVGRTVTIEIPMEVGGLAENVMVTGETPLVDVTSKEVGGNISARELTDLPSPTRNFISFIGLMRLRSCSPRICVQERSRTLSTGSSKRRSCGSESTKATAPELRVTRLRAFWLTT